MENFCINLSMFVKEKYIFVVAPCIDVYIILSYTVLKRSKVQYCYVKSRSGNDFEVM